MGYLNFFTHLFDGSLGVPVLEESCFALPQVSDQGYALHDSNKRSRKDCMECGHKNDLHRGYYGTSGSLVPLLPALISQLSSKSFCVPVSLCDNASFLPRADTKYGHLGRKF